jgi:hypothetical protein
MKPLVMILALLALQACASGEPPRCRGVASPINVAKEVPREREQQH